VAQAVLSPCFLLAEFYTDISGTAVTELTGNSKFPDNPDETRFLTSFEGPTGYADNYGARISGFLTPAETANYIFFMSTDDNGELWLSSDDNPANKQMITEPQWAAVRA
jgi:hypothetical protein